MTSTEGSPGDADPARPTPRRDSSDPDKVGPGPRAESDLWRSDDGLDDNQSVDPDLPDHGDAASPHVTDKAPEPLPSDPDGETRISHYANPRKRRSRTWAEIAEENDKKRLQRDAMRVGRWSDDEVKDATTAWSALPPYLRRRKPTKIEEDFDLEPGVRWVAIFNELHDLVPRHELSALDWEVLLTIILYWQYHAESDEFMLMPKQLEERLYQDRRRIEDSFLRLRDLGLLDHRTGGVKNRTTIGVQPLRHAVTGATERFTGRAVGKDLRRVWGFGNDALWFHGVPERLVEQISATGLPDRARLLCYWLLRERRRTKSDTILIDTAKAAAWMNCTDRTVRRALTDLVDSGAANVVATEDGTWAVSIAPLLDLIKPAPPLRPSNRKNEDHSEGCPKDGAE